MKKSHRKDVILARIIFAIFCLVVITLIAGLVLFIKSKMKSNEPTESQITVVSQESETQGNVFPEIDETQPTEEDTQQELPETQDTEVVEVTMKTTTGVNLRSEPSTSGQVLTVLVQGTTLKMLGEENGWAKVDYQGQSGYVSLDYLEEVLEP